MAKQYQEGWFTPRYPEKYLGDNKTKIKFRSSYELRAFKMLDGNPNVLSWLSEGIPIPYAKPVPYSENSKGWRPATYWPDLYVEYQQVDGTIRKEMVEIKPLKQTKVSRARKATTKLQEDYTYAVNKAKWAYAKEWCRKRGIEFTILTEKSLWN